MAWIYSSQCVCWTELAVKTSSRLQLEEKFVVIWIDEVEDHSLICSFSSTTFLSSRRRKGGKGKIMKYDRFKHG